MKRKKISFKDIANRITGFEVGPVGLSWESTISENDVARRLLTYLEDRRALYAPFSCETGRYVVQSVLDIRRRLTEELENINRESFLAKNLLAMRAACRKFLDSVEGVADEVNFY